MADAYKNDGGHVWYAYNCTHFIINHDYFRLEERLAHRKANLAEMKKTQQDKIFSNAKGDSDKLQDLIKQQVKYPGSLHIFLIYSLYVTANLISKTLFCYWINTKSPSFIFPPCIVEQGIRR